MSHCSECSMIYREEATDKFRDVLGVIFNVALDIKLLKLCGLINEPFKKISDGKNRKMKHCCFTVSIKTWHFSGINLEKKLFKCKQNNVSAINRSVQ